MTTKLSACMIVKNEEDMIAACLDSIVPVCDEVVIVDTGSTDRTIAIATGYGDKIKLYQHPWMNDFSYHRNQSIEHSTGDWLMIIDADEELAPMNISTGAFKARLGKLPVDIKALVITVNELNKKRETCLTWLGGRFFKKDSRFHYYNSIHNQPTFEGQAAGSDIVFYHKGYACLTQEKLDIKHERTTKLLLKRLDENSEDFNAMYYLAHEYIATKKWSDALKVGTRCIELLGDRPPDRLSYYGGLYYGMSNCCVALNDPSRAWSWAEKGIELFPEDIDLYFAMASLGYMCKRDDILIPAAHKFLELYSDEHPFLVGSVDTSKFMSAMELKKCSYRATHCKTETHRNSVEIWLAIATKAISLPVSPVPNPLPLYAISNVER